MNQRLLLLAALVAAAPAPALAQQVARDNIDALIEEQARANGVPASFVHQVVKRESNYNPNAKGGSALGLMQIKHATARGLGYKGDASGLYDPKVNLRYGIAYLAGAYRTAKGDLARAYHYYNRGYYYAAKRQGITTEVADETPTLPAPAASAGAFANLFSLRSSDSAAGPALAYAAQGPSASAPIEVPLPPRRPGTLGGLDAVQVASLDPAAGLAATGAAPPQAALQASAQASASVEVPLPPRRPAALGGLAMASLAAPDLAALSVSPQGATQPSPPAERPAAAAQGARESVEVPLPPRRPAAATLAAIARPPAPKAAAAPILEATALPPAQ
ncbi:transglycosylase SLT domain-containing protein [Methylobacterium durans]|uniref:transglycosylase SLT domain-containing protein n=1 Tax=Methylobacterium durans TaxID=2202825 RepID=UPI002AFE0B65|nr:transglycosylase SLT domain-containing protein [Methylobacterium durans]MEA1833601.1 transglycosylase SLT domain-containing protein [Methylobacterium durans]